MPQLEAALKNFNIRFGLFRRFLPKNQHAVRHFKRQVFFPHIFLCVFLAGQLLNLCKHSPVDR